MTLFIKLTNIRGYTVSSLSLNKHDASATCSVSFVRRKQKPTQFGVLHGSSPSSDPTEWVYIISLMTEAEYVSETTRFYRQNVTSDCVQFW